MSAVDSRKCPNLRQRLVVALLAGLAQKIHRRERDSNLDKVRVSRLASRVRSIVVVPSAVVASAGRILWHGEGNSPRKMKKVQLKKYLGRCELHPRGHAVQEEGLKLIAAWYARV